jgi:phospholipase D1/2
MTALPEDPTAQTAPGASRVPAILGVLGVLVVALALLALWRLTPLRTLLAAESLLEAARRIAASPAAPVLVVLVYVAGTFVLCPLTPLLVATALVFDPWRALGLGLVGALASATLGYAIGRLVARHRPRWLETPRLQPLRARLRRRGVLAMATVRLVPAGNFTIANIVAGAVGIPLRDYLLGNALGLLPGLLALTVLARQLHRLGWLAP